MRKERKDNKKTLAAEKMSTTLSLDNLTRTEEISMKEEVSPKSPTACQNANPGTDKIGPGGIIDSLRTLKKIDGKFRKLIHIVADVDMLVYAYEQIKSKPGNMTPAGGTETLDGINRE
jgi:hypothetical protein